MASRLRGLLRSFSCALSGLGCALRRERNLRIHFCAAAAVLWLSRALGATRSEHAALLLACTLVIAAELLNTAVEYVVDAFTDRYSLPARRAKDAAAAAVLCTAAGAVCTGIAVLWRPQALLALLSAAGESPARIAAAVLLLAAALLFVFLPGSKRPAPEPPCVSEAPHTSGQTPGPPAL